VKESNCGAEAKQNCETLPLRPNMTELQAKQVRNSALSGDSLAL